MTPFDFVYVAITGVWSAAQFMAKVIDAGERRSLVIDAALAAAYAGLAFWAGLMLFA